MLSLAAAECVSELDEEGMNGWRHGWMDEWTEGHALQLPGYRHTTSLQTALLWHHFLLFVPFVDALNIY